MGNLEGRELLPLTQNDLTELDLWIYGRLDEAAGNARSALEGYRYNDGAQALYEFFWNDFCDWYVEATKLSFRHGDEKEKNRAISVLLNVLEESLRLLHPYLPFVTEEIYSKLPVAQLVENRKTAAAALGGNPVQVLSSSLYTGMLVAAPYPVPADDRQNQNVARRFAVLQDVIRSVRALRAECGLSPDAKLNIALQITPNSPAEVCREKVDLIQLLAGVASIDFADEKPQRAIGAVGDGFEAFLLVEGSINLDQLLARFKKELANEQAFADKVSAKLAGKFAQNAPADVVAAEREKLENTKRRIEKLTSYIESL